VTSFSLSTAVLVWYLASGRGVVTLSLRGVRFEWRLFREILRVGVPLSLQPLLNNLTLAALTGYASALGATALAGFGAAVRLEYLMYPLVFGLGAAVLAMVGTNIGARQFSRAVRIAWTAAALSAGVTVGIGLFVIAWPNAWTGLFSSSPAVQIMAASYLCIVAVAYPFIGLNTLTAAFQAMGQTLWPLIGVASRALVVAIGGWIVIHAMDAGLVGLAVVTAAGLITAGAIIAVAFRLKTKPGPTS
jgi:Na+-driven multidrug efflux pump